MSFLDNIKSKILLKYAFKKTLFNLTLQQLHIYIYSKYKFDI